MVEWRMDQFLIGRSTAEMKSCFNNLSIEPRLPLIATNRPVREMGSFNGPEEIRLSLLEEAAKSGADWIDLEHDINVEELARFRQAGAKILLSWHSPDCTPTGNVLRAKLEKMLKTGAEALKIATLAQSGEDNLRVLELIPLARKEFDIELIAFCMGPAGKWSRPASLFLGSPWTYAQFEGQSATAPGQLTVSEMRALVRSFGHD